MRLRQRSSPREVRPAISSLRGDTAPPEVRPAEVRLREVRLADPSTEVRPAEVRPAEVRPAEVHLTAGDRVVVASLRSEPSPGALGFHAFQAVTPCFRMATCSLFAMDHAPHWSRQPRGAPPLRRAAVGRQARYADVLRARGGLSSAPPRTCWRRNGGDARLASACRPSARQRRTSTCLSERLLPAFSASSATARSRSRISASVPAGSVTRTWPCSTYAPYRRPSGAPACRPPDARPGPCPSSWPAAPRQQVDRAIEADAQHVVVAS